MLGRSTCPVDEGTSTTVVMTYERLWILGSNHYFECLAGMVLQSTLSMHIKLRILKRLEHFDEKVFKYVNLK